MTTKTDLFAGKKFDIEHSLGLMADGFVTLPARMIYDNERLGPNQAIIRKCHIYMIGLVPTVVRNVDAFAVNGGFREVLSVGGVERTIDWQLTDGRTFEKSGDRFFVREADGRTSYPNDELTTARLKSLGLYDFEVLYIGQAFGAGGSRNALTRLRKHETLQKISLNGLPKDHDLYVLMIEVKRANNLFTFINPNAQQKSEGDRIDNGLQVLFTLDDAQRTALFEAAFIRYFEPEYNKTFKDSFPSTNQKCLEKCYAKDFSAISAEIHIDGMPFTLSSAKVAPKDGHSTFFDLHSDESRQVFFTAGT